MFEQTQWQPSASIKNLLTRAKLIEEIRRFFTDRGLLEVETPVLSEFGVTDVHLATFIAEHFADLKYRTAACRQQAFHVIFRAGGKPQRFRLLTKR